MYGPWANDFRVFIRDLGHRPAPGYRLVRADKNGNFEPGNLSWSPGSYVEAAPSNRGPDAKTLALVGQEFNKLTVVGVVRYIRGDTTQTCYKARVQCSCGSAPFTLFVQALGKTQSCGCSVDYGSRTGAKSYKFSGYREIRGSYWAHVQHGAETRGLPFEISIEYVWGLFEQQDRKCALSGVPLSFGPYQSRRRGQTASLDRIDASLGYVIGNVQWVHKSINLMRMDLSVEEFVRQCRLVAANCPL